MSLEELFQRAQLWRGGEIPSAIPGIATGYPILDEILPGGWPQGALTEILVSDDGIGAMQLLLPALAKISQTEWVAVITPPHVPYAPALAAAGVNLAHLLVVDAEGANDALWAAEQALRAGSCGAVLAWPQVRDIKILRRLQLAAEAGDCWGVLFRPAMKAKEASPAALRVGLRATAQGQELRILKRRGGGSGRHVTLSFHPEYRGADVSSQPLPAVLLS